MKVLLTGAIAASLAAGIGLAGSAVAADVTNLTLVEHAASDAVTDTGDKGDSVGDILTFNNELFDKANANSLGRDNGWCVRTVAGQSWECFWTAILADGQITVEGPFLDAGDSVLAITGGTGAYAGARGDMKLHARNKDGTEYDFVYALLH